MFILDHVITFVFLAVDFFSDPYNSHPGPIFLIGFAGKASLSTGAMMNSSRGQKEAGKRFLKKFHYQNILT
jgi:hypothetical protein